MPFTPFQKKSSTGEAAADPTVAPGAPPFAKKPFARKRQTGKVAPAQKALMNPGRTMSGGGR